MARHRMHRGLVALSASAIAAVYTVGLIHTRSVDAALSAPSATQQVSQAVAAAPPTLIPTPTAPARIAPASPSSGRGQAPGGGTAGGGPPAPAPTATPASSSASAQAAAYKDGTYAGAGTSRFGNVEVAVSVQGGRITNVSLTRVTTKYPASRIAALPGQVVARQSAQVDNVSGATASAQAFRSAVQQALSKAV